MSNDYKKLDNDCHQPNFFICSYCRKEYYRSKYGNKIAYINDKKYECSEVYSFSDIWDNDIICKKCYYKIWYNKIY